MRIKNILEQWYHRNAESKADHWKTTGTAPHITATRVTYTCPTGKIAMVETLNCGLMRITATTILSPSYCFWAITPSGGSAKEIVMAWINSDDVGDKDNQGIGTTLILFPGDILRGRTYDGSTDGLVAYWLSYKLTEFDIE